jgi:hypothetical protein
VKLRQRGWLDSNRQDRVDEGRAQIAAVRDPRAAPALIKLLGGEEDDWTFEFLLGVLGQLDDPRAVQTLVKYSLQDDDPEIRAKCLDYLTGGMRPVSILPYVQALKSKDNIIVNRAGEALGMIGDPAAISPLIDALVTTHKYQLSPGSNPGQISADFGGSGGGFLWAATDRDETKGGPTVLRAAREAVGKQILTSTSRRGNGMLICRCGSMRRARISEDGGQRPGNENAPMPQPTSRAMATALSGHARTGHAHAEPWAWHPSTGLISF